METVDRSVEQAFFARAMVLSDHPVSFDTEDDSVPRDLETREQRRAHFTRVVGAIVGTLGVGALLALTRPLPRPAEAAPVVVAAPPAAAEIVPVSPEEPTITLPLELTADDPAVASAAVAQPALPAPSASPELAPSTASSARPTKSSAPQRSAARQRVPAAKPVSAPPLIPAESGNRPPPTARFAD
ncbi:MAG: hypothetical protein ABUL60_36235 [Myxococcales bacterium]